jgi:hypothetical protein
LVLAGSSGCDDQTASAPKGESAQTAELSDAEVDVAINKDPFVRAYLAAVGPCDSALERFADLSEAGSPDALPTAEKGIELCIRASQEIAELAPPPGRESAPAVCAQAPKVKADMMRYVTQNSGGGDAARVQAMSDEANAKSESCVAVALPQ